MNYCHAKNNAVQDMEAGRMRESRQHSLLFAGLLDVRWNLNSQHHPVSKPSLENSLRKQSSVRLISHSPQIHRNYGNPSKSEALYMQRSASPWLLQCKGRYLNYVTYTMNEDEAVVARRDTSHDQEVIPDAGQVKTHSFSQTTYI